MKAIKIAHLYYDLMNLYGENGNILALKKAFENQKIRCDIDLLTKDSKIDFSKYDIFYMGMGSLDNQEIVRKDILRYKTEIKKYIDKKTFIMTGNSYELFGRKINNLNGLGVFNFNSKFVDKRIVGEQVYKTYVIKDLVIGFQNRSSINDIDENHLFEVISGNPDDKTSCYEGYHIYDFYGTYLVGPLLIRNPILKDKIVKDVLNRYDYPYKHVDTVDEITYNKYLENFSINKC